ncbi:hypothetical protein OAG71_04055 [bacterium]|nr:hypothetical protein [bacterium]
MMKLRLITCAMAMTVIAATVGTNAHAGAITWMTGVSIDDAGAFVDTTGTLVAALNADTAGDNAVIGGVTFAGTDQAGWNAGVTGVGGVTVTSNATEGNFGTTFTQGSTAPGILDADITNLIGSAIWEAQTVTLGGLTIGDTYIVQIITNDSRNGRTTNNKAVLSDGVNTAAASLTAGTAGLVEHSNTVPGAGNPALPGDATTGTFIADGLTQTIEIGGTTNGTTLNSGGRAQINGFQLRTIPAAIPEPSSAVVGLFGLACLAIKRRKS